MRKTQIWLRLMVSLWLLSAAAPGGQGVQPVMMPSSQAWIKGLPGFPATGGKLIEAVKFQPPQAPLRRLDLVIVDNGAVKELRTHMSSRRSFASLTVVVRRDPVKQEDLEFVMTNATVASVKLEGTGLVQGPAGRAPRQVNLVGVGFVFDKIVSRVRQTANPGPPPGAPPVRQEGVNQGWIYEPSDGSRQAVPMEVVGFNLSENRVRVEVIGRSAEDLRGVLLEVETGPQTGRPLILVLPDKETEQYVEVKLFAPVSVSIEPRNSGQVPREKNSVREIVFGSHWIEHIRERP